MNGYTKLFGSIVTSTVWRLDSDSRIVWVTMLAIADQDGVVSASVPGLAHVAGVSREACERALAAFLAPDPDSRTSDYEGRRIEAVDGGWMLLNHGKYRDMLSLEDRREKAAKRQRMFKARKRGCSPFEAPPVTPGNAEALPVTQGNADPLPVTESNAPFCSASASDLNEGTEGTRAREEPADPAKAPDWFTAALGVIAMGTGVELPAAEAWLRYGGHRAGKGIAPSQRDAQYWLTSVMVPEVREARRRDARDAERTKAIVATKVGPEVKAQPEARKLLREREAWEREAGPPDPETAAKLRALTGGVFGKVGT